MDELIKCLPGDKAFRYVAKYHVHLKSLEDLQWSLKNVLSDIWDHKTMSLSSTTDTDQITCNIYDLINKSQSSFGSIDQQPHISKSSSNPAHTYNPCPWKAVASNK